MILMDYFNDVLTTSLGLERGSCVAGYAGSESLWIFIYWVNYPFNRYIYIFFFESELNQSHVFVLSGVQCPVHSHYELCGSSCEVTCHSLAPPAGCRSPCMEGCVCDPGYIRSGEQCVPLSQCGCLYGSHYYLLYQQFYPGNNCEEVCTCLPDGQV